MAIVATSALVVSDRTLPIARANAQEKPPKPIEDAKKAVETLINHLRGRDMPEGIVKTNGRIEATQVDVAAKYAGRLATRVVIEIDMADREVVGGPPVRIDQRPLFVR